MQVGAAKQWTMLQHVAAEDTAKVPHGQALQSCIALQQSRCIIIESHLLLNTGQVPRNRDKSG